MTLNNIDPQKLYSELSSNVQDIHLFGYASTTKIRNKYFNNHLMLDFELKASAEKFLYNIADPTLYKMIRKTSHFPVRTNHSLENKDIQDVFMYFTIKRPLHTAQTYSIEFIDVSEWIYRSVVFPIIENVFENPEEILEIMEPKLDESIYIYSYLHEVFHSLGNFSAIPCRKVNLKISNKQFAYLGELWADISFLKFQEIDEKYFWLIFFIKIFWYGRFNFEKCTSTAMINTDNDSWEGAVFFELALLAEVFIFERNDKIKFNKSNLSNLKKIIREKFHFFFDDFLALDQEEQSRVVDISMRGILEEKNNVYLLSNNLKKVYNKCRSFPSREF